MVDFICMGSLELQEAKSESYKIKKKFFPTAELELTTPESQSHCCNR